MIAMSTPLPTTPPAWAARARVDQALAANKEPHALWAAARPDVEVGLAVAECLVGRWQFEEAAAVLGELRPDHPATRATAVVLRQRLLAAREAQLDRAAQLDRVALEQALVDLVADARWSVAFDACCLLAADASDLAEIRRLRVLAVGLAEAAGGAWLGAAQLRQLAAAELAAGEAARCLVHLRHALGRLDAALLVGARLERGRCHELAAEALVAVGDVEAARVDLDRAAEAYGHRDFGDGHRTRVAARRAALAVTPG
jgi:hypothetical protein